MVGYSGIKKIDDFIGTLHAGDLIMAPVVSGSSLCSQYLLLDAIVLRTLKHEKKVFWFEAFAFDKERQMKYQKQVRDLSFFRHIKEDESGNSLAGIRTFLKENTGSDLIVIDKADHLKDFQNLILLCKDLRVLCESVPCPVIVMMRKDVPLDVFFSESAAYVDFMLLNEGTDLQNGPSYDIHIRLLDCRIRQFEADLLYDEEHSIFTEKEGSLRKFYEKALSVGFDERDAVTFALIQKEKTDDY